MQKNVQKICRKTSKYEKIKNGTKTIEFRLYDEKRQHIKIGDKIEFSKLPNSIKNIPTSILSDGGIIYIQNKSIELEYDYVNTAEMGMPFVGPAIISDDNEELIDFAETYDYNHFENCFEDKKGIIWADHGRVLVSFPADWESEEYELPDEVEEVYICIQRVRCKTMLFKT